MKYKLGNTSRYSVFFFVVACHVGVGSRAKCQFGNRYQNITCSISAGTETIYIVDLTLVDIGKIASKFNLAIKMNGGHEKEMNVTIIFYLFLSRRQGV